MILISLLVRLATAPPYDVPTAQPVIPLEDTHSYGPTARDWVQASLSGAVYVGADRAERTSFQISIGLPSIDAREVREIYDAYHLSDYELRVRHDTFVDIDGKVIFGPTTVALQRYLPMAPLAISPLLFAHAGVEAAVSTPWASGFRHAPLPLIAEQDAVDSEVATSGWSLRPFSPYFRGDFLACRSTSAELGIEPEAFVPADAPTSYGMRFHAAAGWSFGCHGNMSTYAPKMTLEYRGRIMAHTGDEAPAYSDTVGFGMQVDFGGFSLTAFARRSFAHSFERDGVYGLRLQIGRAK